MICRIARLGPVVLCLLSLLACAGTLWLWRHSYSAGRDRIGFHRSGNRFTIRFERGRATLFGPPPRRTPATWSDKRVDVIVRQFRNEDCRWVTGAIKPADGAPPALNAAFKLKLAITPDLANLFIQMRAQWPAATRGALLAALDDPARRLAAHVALTDKWGYDGDERLMAHVEPGRGWYIHFGMPAAGGGSRSLPDAGQRAMIYDYWRDRFGVPVRSWPIWPLAAATALPPLVWSGARARTLQVRRRRLRLRLCLACGYDLRHSPEKCPECGAAVAW